MVDDNVVDFVNRLKSKINVHKVIFFGSRAKGEHLKHSDYDFIIVSDDFKGMPFVERISFIYRLFNTPYPIEPLCYTIEEFERKKNQICIVQEAVKTGIEL